MLAAVTANPNTVEILAVVALILFVIAAVVRLSVKAFDGALVALGLAFLAGAVVFLS